MTQSWHVRVHFTEELKLDDIAGDKMEIKQRRAEKTGHVRGYHAADLRQDSMWLIEETAAGSVQLEPMRPSGERKHQSEIGNPTYSNHVHVSKHFS